MNHNLIETEPSSQRHWLSYQQWSHLTLYSCCSWSLSCLIRTGSEETLPHMKALCAKFTHTQCVNSLPSTTSHGDSNEKWVPESTNPPVSYRSALLFLPIRFSPLPPPIPRPSMATVNIYTANLINRVRSKVNFFQSKRVAKATILWGHLV